MGWRIHFTAEDMARTKVIPTLGPLAETMFGLWMLRRRGPNARMDLWHDQAKSQLTPEMQPLLAMLLPDSFGVDLWSLTGENATIEEGLDALLAIPPAHLRAELSYASMFGHLPAASWAIADHDGRRALARAAHASYRTLVEPHWLRMRDHLNAERLRKGRLMLENGLGRLFTTLSPQIRWKAPVLEIAVDDNADHYLSGRGLTLVPSLLLSERPLLLDDIAHPERPAILVFPASSSTYDVLESPKRIDLTAMLGSVRARILSTIGDGCTTAEIAGNAKISVASASQHATLLRQAGLITTASRDGAMLHSLTGLGTKFLAGA